MQRLNIDYHFQEEIDAFLHRQYVISTTRWNTYDNVLHHIALCFRLFREQGYYVPAEVFDKFTDKKGKFKQKVGGNIKGMIDLYEASQLSIRGEDILVEAGQFSGLVLKEKLGCLDDHEAKFLPDYMKICFKALYDLTNETSSKIYQKNGWDPTDTLRNTKAHTTSLLAYSAMIITECERDRPFSAVEELVFLVEAEWFASGNIPSAEEYLKNGIVSSGVHIESVEIIDGIPGIISSSATILRLWDDLGNAEDKNEEGNDGSNVNCLLGEQQELSLKRARDEVMSMISDAWKRLNQECLFDTTALLRPLSILRGCYHNHSLPRIEEQLNSLFFHNLLL
ncbi:hypothetical protein CR513_10867, partial [Mucuna pruriens]